MMSVRSKPDALGTGRTVLVMPSVKRTNSIVAFDSLHSGRRVSIRFKAVW